MAGLPYEEMIYQHYATKPYSIDPFNEVGIPTKERDALLAQDFLQSYQALSEAVTQRINERYFKAVSDFGS